MVRAVVTLGRRLQQDVATPHVNLGLRLERDALHVLARMYARWGRAPARDSALAAASRADSAVARWRDAVRLIQTAAVLPRLLRDIKACGYRFVPLDQLAGG